MLQNCQTHLKILQQMTIWPIDHFGKLCIKELMIFPDLKLIFLQPGSNS